MVLHSRTNAVSGRPRLLALLLCPVLMLCAVACAKRSRAVAPAAPPGSQAHNATNQRINLNTASAKELEALPEIGKGLAERIVEHRQKYGRFRRAEHVMMVRGISDVRFRAIRDSVTVE